MASKVTIRPPSGNIPGESVAQPSALERLHGPEEAARRRRDIIENYGFQQEVVGPFADELTAYPAAAIDWLRGQVGEGDFFGFGLGNPQSFGDIKDEYLSAARVAQDQYREENPATSIGANVLGGLAVAPARGAALVQSPGFLARVGQGAKAGAVGGGVAGAGEGRGGIVGRGAAGAAGAGAGAVVGGAIPGITALVAGTGRALARALNFTGRGAEQKGRALFLKALEADGIEVSDLAKITKDRPLTMADLGDNTRKLLGQAYRNSDEGRKIISQFLDERARGQFDRMTGDLAREIGENPSAFAQRADDLIATRRANASTSYDAAYSGRVEVTPELRELLSRAEKLGGVTAGRRLGQAEGIEFPDDIMKAEDIGVDALDYLTRGLSDAGAPGSNERRIARGLAQRIHDIAPELAAARQQYATDSALIDALDEGRKFLRGDSEMVARSLGAMSPEEQAMFRLGAARELRGKFAKVRDTGDRARFFENEDMRERLRAVFPDEQSFARFMKAAEEEAAMNVTRGRVMQGSPTAERLADDAAFSGDLATVGADLVGGGGVNAVLRAAMRGGQDAMRRVGGRLDEAAATEVARLGTTPNPATLQGPLNQAMVKAQPLMLPDTGATAPLIGRVQPSARGVAAGAAAGRAVAPDEPTESKVQIRAPGVSVRPPEFKTTGDHVRMDEVRPEIKTNLTALQRRWGKALPVSSGYRDADYNRQVGGAKKSQHMHGNAIDIDLSGMPLKDRLRLLNMASEVGFTGIGVYDDSIHLDMGGRRAWGPSRSSDSVPKWAAPVINRHLKRAG